MKEKTLVLVDWENFRHDIERTKCTNHKNALNVIATIKAFLLDDEVISRIYFYTTPPFNFDKALQEKEGQYPQDEIEAIQNQESSRRQDLYKDIENFQKTLASLDWVELRLGKTKLVDIKKTSDGYKPLLEQKQVDMLIGLDIARIAFKKTADRILLFSKDTDLIPALRLARNEGLRVDIASLTQGLYLHPELSHNSDMVRKLETSEVEAKIVTIKQDLSKTNWAF